MDDSLAGAISLARALISLSRSGQSGTLEVWGEGARAKVTIVGGIPRAATAVAGADELLGDALLRKGQLNWEAHQVALNRVGLRRPVGHWLVEMGIATRAAVQTALQRQLRSRLLRLFWLRKPEYRFLRGQTAIGVPLVGSSLSVAEVSLQGLKQTLSDNCLNQIRQRVGNKILRLTPLGRFFLNDSALIPEADPLLRLLDAGADFQTIERATANPESALRTVAALVLLSAATVDPATATQHALLVRKHRQVRAHASPAALLDLPPGASPSQAGRALRRLSAQLHPDRLGPDAPHALQQVSSDVIKALARAETELRPRIRPH
jgi:hypothetical protein